MKRNLIGSMVAIVSWFSVLTADAQDYGLDTAQAIAPYLNGVFPSATPGPSGTWQVVDAFPNLSFVDPVRLIHRSASNRFYVVGKSGQIWFFENSPTTSSKTLFLDLAAQTRVAGDSGLLGLVFHPEYGDTGSPNRDYVYVYYRYTPDKSVSNGSATPGYMRLSRFTVSQSTETALPGSELVLINQYDRHDWHQGGGMFFAPDGFLYLTVGDEGAARDSYNSAQKLDGGLFSGLLRLDVDMDPLRSHPIRRQPQALAAPPSGWPATYSANYYVPNDNPWQDPSGGVLEEFYAVGLRSPHTSSYDADTGEIWVGDVGQGSREEVSVIRKGDNLQWPYREGDINGAKSMPSPLIGNDTPPMWAYPRIDGGCVIGGFVYRGQKFAGSLFGKYLVGDHNTRSLWALTPRPGQSPLIEYLASMPGANGGKAQLAAWGTDDVGNVYMCKPNGTGNGAGKIYKLAQSGTAIPEPPATLSLTGAFTDLNTLTPAPGLIPYDVNAPLFSDNAAKRRWIAVPNDGSHNTAAEKIAVSAEGGWEFPPGSVIVKHFELPVDEGDPSVIARLETRFLIFGADGGIYGVTYRWRDDGSDADLLAAGESRDLTVTLAGGGTREQQWKFPSRADCLSCHNDNAGRVLGLKNHQQNGDFLYPLSGRSDNQLRALNHIGLLSPALNEAAIPSMPRAADLDEVHASLEHRVKSYLDSNCAQCHRPDGVAANFDARFTSTLADQGLIGGELVGSYLPADSSLIEPGDLARSIFHQRDISTGDDRMPPLGRTLIDDRYRQVLEAWIGSMPGNFTADPGAGPAPPIAVTDSASLEAGASALIDVLSNDSDDANALYGGALALLEPPTNGSVAFDAASGAFIYSHDGTATSSDQFSYTVSDPRGNISAPATVTLSITPAGPGGGGDSIADYPFDIDFTDASDNQLDLGASGGPQIVSVPGRTVARFSGVGDQLSVAVPDDLIMPGSGHPVTLEVALFPRSYPAFGAANASIVRLEQSWDTSLAIGQDFWDEAPYVQAGDVRLISGDTWQQRITLMTWNTVRLEFDGQQTFSLTINGTPVTSVDWTPGYDLGFPWQLAIGNFDGDIDSVKILAGGGGGPPPPPVDTTPPSVNLTAAGSSTSAAFPVDVAFSEAVSGLTASDFIVSNGSAIGLAGSDAGYTLSINAAAAGPVTIRLPAGAASDAADNLSLASNTVQVTYSPTPPPPPPPPPPGGSGNFYFGVQAGTNQAFSYQAGGLRLTEAGGRISASYTRIIGADRVEVLEASSNLAQWIALGSPSIVANGDGSETVSYTNIDTMAPLVAALGFVRLRVESGSPAVITRTLPLGWYEADLAGTQAHGISLIRSSVQAAEISSVVSNSQVTLLAPIETAVLQNGSYYVEVLSGDSLGHRFDVDEAGSSPTTLVLDLAPAYNTRSGADNSLVGTRVVIRRHWTLGEAYPLPQFSGGADPSSADQIKVYDKSTSAYVTYFSYQGSKWARDGDASLVDQGSLVLAPAAGAFVTRATPASLRVLGEVRGNAFVQPLLSGSTFVAEPFPLSLSPTDRQMDSSEVFIGSSDPDGADTVMLWNGSAYDRYYLWENWPTNYWRRLGSTANENAAKLFDFRRAAFVTTLWGYHPNYTVPVPWTP